MTTELAQKLQSVRDFKKILETVVKDLGETYSADVSQIVLSNPLDRNLTSICEYKLYPEAEAGEMPVHKSFPLPIEGQYLGAVTLARRSEFHENELNWIRITLAELSDVIRHAQINDLVQRDTFRDTFMAEIQNVMQYSLGIGDALFMVVNILGKVLNVSRCLFICVDDEKAGWKAYEFWQRDKVQSCQSYAWPTTDSPTVARSLLASSPMFLQEANQNSRLTPVQEELQLLGVRSLLGIPLKSESATHGCIILHHCDSRHAWTRGEIDMVQNVADTVAEALNKLPEEKRVREPIMRLHQRDVAAAPEGTENASILAVRRALRGALGAQAIPTAGTKTAPAPAPKAAPAATLTNAATAAPATPVTLQPGQPTISPVRPAAAAPTETGAPNTIPSLGNAADLGAMANAMLQQAQASGDPKVASEVSSTLQGLLQSMGVTQTPNSTPATPPAVAAPQLGNNDTGGTGAGRWGDLDSIGTPNGGGAAATPVADAESNGGNGGGAWGNLDSIPTPAAGPARGGLGSSMISKKTTDRAAQSSLLASLHKDKSRFEKPVEFIDGGTIEIDEAQAQAKLKQVLASSSPTSDYIFATPVLDPRMLGRIDGWISQIEQKDKYDTPHAMTVAEYSVAIGHSLGLPDTELLTLRLAGILHDVGKLGLAANILQKPEEELSDTELLLIMKHPIDGAKLVEGFPELAHIAPIILTHHEEWDGNGFPAGQAGEDIPLAARIIHAASAYHNMTGPTKRRERMSQDEAAQTLRSLAGKTFDPQVVEALISCAQEGTVAAVR
jgi:HD-GYP domain-containing protein (c-di-GMP phosphodiesterase class II)/GAF domain-containing protein